MGIGTFRSRWSTCEVQVQVHGRSGPGGLDLWYQYMHKYQILGVLVLWGTYKSACFVSGHSTDAKPHAPILYRFNGNKKKTTNRITILGWPLCGLCTALSNHGCVSGSRFPPKPFVLKLLLLRPRVSFHCNSRVC